MPDVVCKYCGNLAKLVYGDHIYPRFKQVHAKRFYRCDQCDAHVGCHGESDKPLGDLANAELRSARQEAHENFDYFWRKGRTTRSTAYQWLSSQLGIDRKKTHIGMFDLETCYKVVSLCSERRMNDR